ncbi:nuclear receptor 2DBD gamma [Brachionus plicatilis]|uniref:Nuclear receptor 2DBD gamma n=1 Tax=Brachionus plicatilis TaxID=10195 RepID=A0A3M7SF22_BRAPC|nr:nuclear receptor 2DBD gamma [Brachionus plicatilis]
MSTQNYSTKEADSVCKVCGDEACNWYYGAMVCEACKKFFIRSKKEQKRKYICVANKQCNITKSTRANCQYCRFKKCVQVGLDLSKKASQIEINSLVQSLKCAVCSQQPSGIHFGVMSCEACKGFFRRSALVHSDNPLKCKSNGNQNCLELTNRSCRYCRFKKCLEAGMSLDNSKLGRTTNKVKQEIIKKKKEREIDDQFDSIQGLTKQNPCKKTRYNFQENQFNNSLSSTSSYSSTESLPQITVTYSDTTNSDQYFYQNPSYNQTLTNINYLMNNQHNFYATTNEDQLSQSQSNSFLFNPYSNSNVYSFNAPNVNQNTMSLTNFNFNSF